MRKKKELPPHFVQLMEKVKKQLAEIKKPKTSWKIIRNLLRQRYFPTVEEYQSLDPYWQSTMSGKMAGRKLGERR